MEKRANFRFGFNDSRTEETTETFEIGRIVFEVYQVDSMTPERKRRLKHVPPTPTPCTNSVMIQ